MGQRFWSANNQKQPQNHPAVLWVGKNLLRPGTVATHQIVGLHYALLDTCSRYGTELNTIIALSKKW